MKFSIEISVIEFYTEIQSYIIKQYNQMKHL